MVLANAKVYSGVGADIVRKSLARFIAGPQADWTNSPPHLVFSANQRNGELAAGYGTISWTG